MAIRKFDPEAWMGEDGMQLVARGEDVLVRATFSRTEGDLEQFLFSLRTAILLWMRQHPYPVSAKLRSGARPNAATQAWSTHFGALRLPQNSDEEQELSNAAEAGPAAVYRWIYGPDSLMTKAMKGASWKQFGVEKPEEGCKRILQSIRDHHADLRAVRPHLKRVRAV